MTKIYVDNVISCYASSKLKELQFFQNGLEKIFIIN